MQCLLIFGTGLSGNLSKFTFNQFEEIFSNKFEEIFLLLLIITTFLTPRHNFNTNSTMQIVSPSFLLDFCQFLKMHNVTNNPNVQKAIFSLTVSNVSKILLFWVWFTASED